MMKKMFLSLCLMTLVFAVTGAMAGDEIGRIHTLKGKAEIERGTERIAASTGLPLNQGDIVRTGDDGGLGIVLWDDTSLSMGPDSGVVLTDFVFHPIANKFAVVLRMVKGAFVYQSGVISKLAPDSIRLDTPASTIKVHGTRLLIEVVE